MSTEYEGLLQLLVVGAMFTRSYRPAIFQQVEEFSRKTISGRARRKHVGVIVPNFENSECQQAFNQLVPRAAVD